MRALVRRWLDAFFCKAEKAELRTFHINDRHKNDEDGFEFRSNSIKTTKYSWYSFLPRGLFEQFRRVANLYFLFQACVSLTPVSPVNPITTITPLVFVVGIAMLKELYEDIQRGRSDHQTNNRKVHVLGAGGAGGGGGWERRRWRDVQVGDILKVENDHFFPADLICLATSKEDGGCFLETMNLDGETNLKLRQAVPETRSLSEGQLAGLRGVVECELPNVSIYTFAGKMAIQGAEDKTIFLSQAQILLRGSTLRNTDFVIGAVVYTGRETKIMMNATDPPSKRSFVERRLDFIILFDLMILFGMALVTSIMSGVSTGTLMESQWYLDSAGNDQLSGLKKAQFDPTQPLLAGFLQLFTSLVLYGYFVPISLYVTLEIIKLVQAGFIRSDVHCFYEESNIPLTVRTSNLNEELGMIKTILSDKTGTLTRNQMDFFKCSISGVAYGTGITEVEKAAAERAGRPVPEGSDDEDEDDTYVPEKPLEKGFNMKDARLDSMNWINEPHADDIRRFLQVLGVCHTVVAELPQKEPAAADVAAGGADVAGAADVAGDAYVAESEDPAGGTTVAGSEAEGADIAASVSGSASRSLKSSKSSDSMKSFKIDPDNIKYMAESPDEAAFVVAAKRFGVFFYGREGQMALVREFGRDGSFTDVAYELLNTLEFTSARKRMSVVVRTPSQELLLLCKGADSIILNRLANSEPAQRHRPITEQHMKVYAEAGLRTLALAYRELDESEYASWQRRWQEAKEYVADAAVQREKLEALADELETGLILLGATAIEDKLQVGVPQTIANLAKAGIKLWVLTGDKLETAINIGFACNLLRHEMKQHLVALEDNSTAIEAEAAKEGKTSEEYSAQMVRSQIQQGLLESQEERHRGELSHAVIVDGRSLQFILSDPPTRSCFLALALACESVICCRVSPKQKAEVTQLVREEGNQICLSVGDGANDVGMIQKANIGVGIAGVEGQQAVMASDFAIGQFRFLERLLLVHGGWSYKRISRAITYFFFKSFTFGVTTFTYNCFALWSGSSIYYDWYLSLYNVIFSAFPVGVFGILDQDVKPIYRLRYPGLYLEGQRNEFFTAARIATWMLEGVYQAEAIFWFTLLPFWLASTRSDGLMLDLTCIGTIMYFNVVASVNLENFVFLQYLTWLHHVFIWGCIILFVLFVAIGSSLSVNFVGRLQGVFLEVFGSPETYLLIPLVVITALLPGFLVRTFRRHLVPCDFQVVQEIARMEYKKRKTLKIQSLKPTPRASATSNGPSQTTRSNSTNGAGPYRQFGGSEASEEGTTT